MRFSRAVRTLTLMTINDLPPIGNHVMMGRWSATAGRSGLGGNGNSGAEVQASAARPSPVGSSDGLHADMGFVDVKCNVRLLNKFNGQVCVLFFYSFYSV